MKFKQIRIENFGVFQNGTEVKIDGGIATIIGDNGSGKSTLLFLINLLLNRKERRKGITVEWIPDTTRNSVVDFTLDVESIEKMGVFLPIEEEGEIFISMSFIFDKELNLYFPEFKIGRIEETKFTHYQKLPFDNVVKVINITPIFENFNENWIENHYSGDQNLLSFVDEVITEANNKITKRDGISTFNKRANKMVSQIMNGEMGVHLKSNIKTTKVGKALNFFPHKNEKIIETHGSGFDKIFSILANIESNKEENKIHILTIDELENHFFFSYQTKILQFLESLLGENISQIILTTHSPNVVKINKNSSITKMLKDGTNRHFKMSETYNYEYYQKDLATAIFYENILMVEGHSEKIFYEYVLKNNQHISSSYNLSNLHILSNGSAHFVKSFLFLREMVNNIDILTDNDVWKSKSKTFEEMHGLKRIDKLLKALDNSRNNQIDFKLTNKDSEEIAQLKDKAEAEGIYTQKQPGHSFEEALVEEGLLEPEDMNQLKKGKLKNMPKFLESMCKKVDESTIKNSQYIFKWMSRYKNE